MACNRRSGSSLKDSRSGSFLFRPCWSKGNVAVPKIARYDDGNREKCLSPYRRHVENLDENRQRNQIDDEIGEVKKRELRALAKVIPGGAKNQKLVGQVRERHACCLRHRQHRNVVE